MKPTNDLDVDTIRSLEEALLEFAGCAGALYPTFDSLRRRWIISSASVVVSHDRFFLDRICTHILAYEGNSEIRFFLGNYQEYEAFHKASVGGELNDKKSFAPLANA